MAKTRGYNHGAISHNRPRKALDIMSSLSNLSPGDLLSFPDGSRVLRIEEVFPDGYVAANICPITRPGYSLEFVEWSIDTIISKKLVPCIVAHDETLAVRYVN